MSLATTVSAVRWHAMLSSSVFSFMDHFAINATGLCVKLSDTEFVSFANMAPGQKAEIEEPKVREINFANGLCVVYDLPRIIEAARERGPEDKAIPEMSFSQRIDAVAAVVGDAFHYEGEEGK